MRGGKHIRSSVSDTFFPHLLSAIDCVSTNLLTLETINPLGQDLLLDFVDMSTTKTQSSKRAKIVFALQDTANSTASFIEKYKACITRCQFYNLMGI